MPMAPLLPLSAAWQFCRSVVRTSQYYFHGDDFVSSFVFDYAAPTSETAGAGRYVAESCLWGANDNSGDMRGDFNQPMADVMHFSRFNQPKWSRHRCQCRRRRGFRPRLNSRALNHLRRLPQQCSNKQRQLRLPSIERFVCSFEFFSHYVELCSAGFSTLCSSVRSENYSFGNLCRHDKRSVGLYSLDVTYCPD